VPPLAGRFYSNEEDQPGRENVVVVSERLWRKRFDGDPGIIGKALRINNASYVVAGIMPKSFDPVLTGSELWVPEQFTNAQIADHDNHYLNVLARLKPEAMLEQAQSELNVIAQRLAQDYPLDNKDRGLVVRPLTSYLLGDQRLVLRAMLAAVGF